MSCPSPPERSIETPVIRCKDSAKFVSGNLPISSAEMESTTPPASLLASIARPSEPLIPRTSIISGSCAAVSATAGSVAIVLSTASTALDTPFFL